MNFPQRRLIAWSLLLVAAVVGAVWLLRLDYGRKISTDVLDLIPADERNPEVAIVRELASQAEARTMLFVLSVADGRPAPLEAARRFATELMGTSLFSDVVALADPEWRDEMGQELFALRLTLLFPGWLRDHAKAADLPRAAARELKAFLETPEALAFQDLIPADPLLLLPRALSKLQGALPPGPADGAHPPLAAEATGLLWAQIADSPLREAGQAPVFAAIERAAAAVRGEFPQLRVASTGVNRFAAASRARIEREISWLNALSLAAVLAVTAIFIRQVHRALHLVPVIAFAVLGAWVATTAVFERVHIIVFVLGALLTGVAIDYGFYLFLQPPATPDEDYAAKVRRLAKPLLASCGTTVTGFALLLFSELPMIRQLGVFVGAGLLCALAAAVLYFATVRHAFLAARAWREAAVLSPAARSRLRLGVIALWACALPGLWRISWRDDIRELEVPSAQLQAEDARIRAAFGDRRDRVAYLTIGATRDDARAALGRLEGWLAARRIAFGNVSAVIPSREDFRGALRFARDEPTFAEALASALRQEGFSPEEFAAFFKAYTAFSLRTHERDLDGSVQRLRAALRGPPGLLVHFAPQRNWFVTLAAAAPGEAPPADTHTVAASQLQSLNRLFADYRRSAVRLSLAGLALVGLGVLLTYGVRDGVRIFAIPCGACLGIFGLLGWLGHPLNLFHLLGAFLGVCLTHNYSIFSATSAYRREPPPVSVRLSALTTAASFGVLALSGIPVVRALGVTVAAMVIAALVVIELEHLAPLARET